MENMGMWEHIFDFLQRETIKDDLTFDDLGLLFFISKSIIDEKFLFQMEPELYKDFHYKEILAKIPTFKIKLRQIKNLIFKLINAGYIKAEQIHGGVKVRLTFKYFNSISKKQKEDEGNIKYYFLLKWKSISTSQNESGNKFPSFYDYYIYIINKYNLKININKDLDTNVNNVNTTTIGSNKEEPGTKQPRPLAKLFEKYHKFYTKQLQMVPAGFDVDRLIARIDASKKYLQVEANLEFLLSNYNVILTGRYDDKTPEQLARGKKPVAIPKETSRDYSQELDLFSLI